MKAVVGIITFNQAAYDLDRLVRSIEGAAVAEGVCGTQIEILILDNGDATAAEVRGTKLGVRYLPPRGNIGFSKGMNLLLAEAFGNGLATDFLCLNPDGLLHRDFFKQMIAFRNRYPLALLEGREFPEEHPKVYDVDTFDTPWATGAALMIPKSAYSALGGFDEDFFMYCEDVDYCWRARAKGIPVKHVSGALFSHEILGRPESSLRAMRAKLGERLLAHKWGFQAKVVEFETDLVRHGFYASTDDMPRLGEQHVLTPAERRVANFDYPTLAPSRW